MPSGSGGWTALKRAADVACIVRKWSDERAQDTRALPLNSVVSQTPIAIRSILNMDESWVCRGTRWWSEVEGIGMTLQALEWQEDAKLNEDLWYIIQVS